MSAAEESQPLHQPERSLPLAQNDDGLPASPSGASGDEECATASCRVCLEDDEVQRLVAPCKCTGSMMYAHQACIQRWIDEKGNRTCEICHGQFSAVFADPPAPPPQQQRLIPLNTLLLAMPHTQDEEDDEYEYDSGGMRMSLALAFMCMLTITQVFQMMGAGGEDPAQNPAGSSFVYVEPSVNGTATGQPLTVNGQLGLAGLMLASMFLRLILILVPVFVVCRVLAFMGDASLRAHVAGEPRMRLDRELQGLMQAMEEGTRRQAAVPTDRQTGLPASAAGPAPTEVELAPRGGQ